VVRAQGDDRRRGAVGESVVGGPRGLDELLVSPAVKRRAGIELRCKGVDADAVAAGEMVGKYQRSLKSV